MATVLIVEDERAIRTVLLMHLSLVGYETLEAEDATEARKLIAQQRVDLAILDIMLPGEDGFSLGKMLIENNIPIMFLTAKTAVTDRVHGLQMGAQDYMLKPFEPAELLARIENILRRTKHTEDVLQCNHCLTIDFDARKVILRGEEVGLTAIEFDLLSQLVRRRNVALSREELLDSVWGYEFVGETRTVDVHIQRLRAKIGSEWIETVYKYGYRFRQEETQ